MKEKKVNLVLLLLIVLLLIVVVGLSVMYMTKKTTISESNTTNNATDDNTSKVLTAEEKYKKFSNNLVAEIKKFDGKNNAPGEAMPNRDMTVVLDESFNSAKNILLAYVDYNGDAYLVFKNNSVFSQYNTNGKYKFKSGVIGIYNMKIGNGGYSAIYTINSDGTVSFINSPDLKDNKILVEDETVKNIVNIQQITDADSAGVIAIDIEGNTYDV